MKRTSLSRIEKLESRANIDELKITIIKKIVERDEVTGKLYITHGYRKKLWMDEPEEYLPREYFIDEDPTPISLINQVGDY